MRIVFFLLLIICAVLAYFWWVRPYLKLLPSFSEIYAKEASLWATIKTWALGRRTILIGIWGEFIAWAPDGLQAVSGFDLKTLLHLPPGWAEYVQAVIPVLMAIFRALA